MRDMMTSVVRRYVRTVPRFTGVEKGRPAHAPEPIEDDMEGLIGWYQNPAPWEDSWVLFSAKGLRVTSPCEDWQIEWEGIIDYEVPPSKDGIEGVRVKTDNCVRFVRMAGSYGEGGQFKDAFALTMIILAIKRDRYRQDLLK